MGECINLRRGGNPKKLPVLDANYPADVTSRRINKSVCMEVRIAKHGNPAEYSYQWYLDGSPYAGATESTWWYWLGSATGTHTIYCEVTNAAGTVQSRTATVTLTDAYIYNAYNLGYSEEYAPITGGWVLAKGFSDSKYSVGTLEKQNSGLYCVIDATSAGKGRDAFVRTVNKIDLTNYSQIKFRVTYNSHEDASNYKWKIGATSVNEPASSGVAVQAEVPNNGTGEYTVDISSLSGSYYVGFWNWVWYDVTARFKVSYILLLP